ncbi:MAG: hypothetical protein EPN72_08715 [Nevskiaceae bacterium]|nr:MAG: hypothetical protein EPN63_08055 [Nevskiaceae bacterium]TBR72524.1 MAG: hypothetical protein EPN72_08715 [Nevskiaceae bacterium]
MDTGALKAAPRRVADARVLAPVRACVLACALACSAGWAAAAHAALDIQIHGLEDAESDNVKAQLGLVAYAKKLQDKTPEPAEVTRLMRQADVEIERALQPFGWYAPTIRETRQHTGDDWRITFHIDAGPATKVAKIDIRLAGAGARLPALVAAAQRRWPLKVGKQIRAEDYETVKRRLQDAAKAAGYLRARYTRHELRIDPATHGAEVLLTLDTGERFYFGTVTIQQDKPRLRENVIRRYLKIYPDAPFEAGKLLDAQFALSDLGYFQSVSVEAQSENATADRHIPVVVHVTYAKPFVFRFGAGYGTDTGLRALAGMDWRRINSRGHAMSLDLRPSQKISSAIARYDIPFGDVPGQKYQLSAQGLRQDFQGIRETLYQFGAERIKLHGYLQRRYYLNYLNDTYTIGGEPGRHSALLMPGIAFSRTSVDNPIYPRHGWYANLDVHGATRAEGISSANFLSARLQLKGVIPLGWRWRVLARGEQGAIIGTNFDGLPPSQRFFAGGEDSVRGYAYRSLAPKNAYGRIAGGKYLTTASLELDWDVHRPFALAAFADAGGADNTPNVRLHYGAGVGLRYVAPFGSIGIDLSHPFDRGASPVHFDFTVRAGL